MMKENLEKNNGILLVDKSPDFSSFYLIKLLRKITNIQKIGHAGTLDPFATGLMILLIGKEYTKKSDQFLNLDKEYLTTLHLGISTDTFDTEGKQIFQSDKVPTLEEIHIALEKFQGTISQTPPMFSAKKIKGKKLYELARKGIEVERKPVEITLKTDLLSYEYPFLNLRISCSKGTYIRSIGDELGKVLGCGAHLKDLRRTRIGSFLLETAISQKDLEEGVDFQDFLIIDTPSGKF